MVLASEIVGPHKHRAEIKPVCDGMCWMGHTHASLSRSQLQINTAFLEGGDDDDWRAEDSVSHPTLSPLDDVIVLCYIYIYILMVRINIAEAKISQFLAHSVGTPPKMVDPTFPMMQPNIMFLNTSSLSQVQAEITLMSLTGLSLPFPGNILLWNKVYCQYGILFSYW